MRERERESTNSGYDENIQEVDLLAMFLRVKCEGATGTRAVETESEEESSSREDLLPSS